MNKSHKYLQTSLWHQERIDNPYEYLDEFFAENYLKDYRELIMQFCEAAFSTGKYWSKAAPGNLIFYLGKFESLINVAFILGKSKKFTVAYESNIEFSYENEVIMLLTNKEVENPMLVIKKFFKENNIKEWKRILGLIMEHSLEISSMVYENEMYNGNRICRFLIRLTEAAFVLHHKKNKNDKKVFL